MSDEYLDMLDEKGRLTGGKLLRDELHSQEHWHGVAHVWIYNDKGQILLQKRHFDVEWAADKWDLAAGGHILSGESPLQAAIRECKEEIGLILKPEELVLAGEITNNSRPHGKGLMHKTYQWNFIVKQNLDPNTQQLQANETADLKWFDLDEFEADIESKEKFKRYAPRQPELYALIISKVRERTNK